MKDIIDDNSEEMKYLVFEGKESNTAYNTAKEEIKILFKEGVYLLLRGLCRCSGRADSC